MPREESLVGDLRRFTSSHGFHILAHRLEIPLLAIDSHRNAVDQRKRIRVFGEHGSEHS